MTKGFLENMTLSTLCLNVNSVVTQRTGEYLGVSKTVLNLKTVSPFVAQLLFPSTVKSPTKK